MTGNCIARENEKVRTSASLAWVVAATLTLGAVAVTFPQAANGDVTLTPKDGSGDAVYVQSPSGKTACSVQVNNVDCGQSFAFPTPERNGCPVNGVTLTSSGNLNWVCGDLGAYPSWFHHLEYGSTYKANGWTIVSSTGGTTFTNNATGRGMTINAQGANTF